MSSSGVASSLTLTFGSRSIARSTSAVASGATAPAASTPGARKASSVGSSPFSTTACAPDERLSDLEDALERRAMEQRFEIDRLEAAVHSLSDGIEALRALIAAVSQAEDL